MPALSRHLCGFSQGPSALWASVFLPVEWVHCMSSLGGDHAAALSALCFQGSEEALGGVGHSGRGEEMGGREGREGKEERIEGRRGGALLQPSFPCHRSLCNQALPLVHSPQAAREKLLTAPRRALSWSACPHSLQSEPQLLPPLAQPSGNHLHVTPSSSRPWYLMEPLPEKCFSLR